MRCDDAGLLLLEAEIEELEGRADSELSRHVRACPRCAAMAAHVLRANDELDAHLTTAVDEEAVAAVLSRLGAGDAAGAAVPRGRGGARWRRTAWGSLALAAAASGLLLLDPAASPVPDGPPPAVAYAPARPLMEDSGGGTVAVLETDNPDITVLWFF